MIDSYQGLFERLPTATQQIRELVAHRLHADFHGDFARWCQVVLDIADIDPQGVSANIDGAVASIFHAGASDHWATLLRGLHPWRKGPWQYGDTFVDTEWRSNLKFDRLIAALGDVQGASVSGYRSRQRLLQRAACASWCRLGVGR